MQVHDWLGTDNKIGIDIWENKYRNKGESFDQWLDRVSGGDKDVRSLIEQKRFLFGGRILASRGLHGMDGAIKTTYSNCYCIPAPEDNLESIFDTAKNLARTFSYGGGVGIDLSKLAPSGAKVRNAAKESSGAVSFMDLYSMVTGLISQNGRRGALMLSMSCDHPDIEQFIDIKKDLSRVTKANISVRVTNAFMQAVIDDRPFELKFTRKETGETISKTVSARELMMKLAQNNWDMGEPGVLFWDQIESWNMLCKYDDFQFAGVNPCAEEPLPAGGSCLLGSLNLSEFVNDGEFDYDSFCEAVRIAVRALNDVLDEGLPLHPLQIQRDSVRDWRQIGLGIFGLADMLIKLGIRYGSEDAIAICDNIGYCMARTAYAASVELAYEHGMDFPKFNPEKTRASGFLRRHDLFNVDRLYNSQLLTIAPTGTLSTMLGVSGGIEPIYANSYERKTESLHGEDVYYKVYTPIVQQYMDTHGITNEKDLPNYFVTAKDIDYHDRIKMQAIWQTHIDASISSTINLPNETTPEEIMDIYISAWKAGLKGVTVFRDGCRREGILSTHTNHVSKDEPHGSAEPLPWGSVIEANDNVVGKKRKLITGCGSLHCVAFFDPASGDLVETYLSKGSNGGCQNFMIGLSRMISLAARSGVGVDSIVDQLESCGVCPSYAVRRATKHDTSSGSCCPVAVGRALKDMWMEMQGELDDDSDIATEEVAATSAIAPVCPECGEPLVFEGGCNICKNCGWSKCS